MEFVAQCGGEDADYLAIDEVDGCFAEEESDEYGEAGAGEDAAEFGRDGRGLRQANSIARRPGLQGTGDRVPLAPNPTAP
jgi:hypothetical protein